VKRGIWIIEDNVLFNRNLNVYLFKNKKIKKVFFIFKIEKYFLYL